MGRLIARKSLRRRYLNTPFICSIIFPLKGDNRLIDRFKWMADAAKRRRLQQLRSEYYILVFVIRVVAIIIRDCIPFVLCTPLAAAILGSAAASLSSTSPLNRLSISIGYFAAAAAVVKSALNQSECSQRVLLSCRLINVWAFYNERPIKCFLSTDDRHRKSVIKIIINPDGDH